MKHPQLKVEKRTVLGKQLKKLRRENILPGNVYGQEMKSQAVQVTIKDFLPVYNEVHETGLVDLLLDGVTLPVLIRQVHKDYLHGVYLHADFFKVNLKEKIKSNIPVVPVGEPIAVSERVGVLLHPVGEIEVEALPSDLPEHIEVNVEKLAQVDEQITVADLSIPQGVTILTDPNTVVVKIGELVTKEAQEEAEQQAAEVEAAKEQTEGQETDATKEENATAEEKTETTTEQSEKSK